LQRDADRFRVLKKINVYTVIFIMGQAIILVLEKMKEGGKF